MQNNYVKNKLLFSLSACAILLGLSNSSALAQQRKPTTAEIERAKTRLRQQVQSSPKDGSPYSIKDYRSASEKQDRENFVNAWKEAEPEIAPFLGSWSDYEQSWNIYPSNQKGRVCIIRVEEDFIDLYLGTMTNNELYINNTEMTANHGNGNDVNISYVFFQEDNYLGYLGTLGIDEKFANDIPLNSPSSLREPYLFKDMDGYSLPEVILKQYANAGCTTSLPSKSNTMTQIKMPDSLKLTLEQKGTNTETEFVKGNDGYYNWFVRKEGFLSSLTNSIFNSLANNTSGTCLGLKENKDLAKVKLTTYRCDSPEGSRKWEILMVNDNTGYKIKLPNTKYCLRNNVGFADCDSSDVAVENLTPEQYKEFTGRIMPEKKETTLTASNLGCSQNTDKFPDLGNLPWKKRLDYCSSIDAYSGILFDSLTPEKQENGTTKLNMEVFNRGSADALIEIYNSTGNLEDIKIIEGNRPPSDLINSGHDLFTKVPASFFSKYPVDDHRHNLTKQSIEIIIPSGGSVKIAKSSKYADLYNQAMMALEISQLKSGDPAFTKSDTVKKLIKGFIKESGNKSAINIFTSEPALQGVFSLDFLDKNKLAEVLYELVKYSSKVEKDPTKNPFLGAFKDVYIDAANIGIENALDRYILPGLGTVARGVRVTGNAVNTYARSLDYSNAMINGDKSTIILEDK
jgi:hypothetical protein